MRSYDFRDHTADIIARARGSDLNEAFAAAAEAMFDIITGGADIRPERDFTLQVESIDIEGLLVSFLSELIVLHETENVVLAEFRIDIQSHERLTVKCRGEAFDPGRHGEGTHVKAASYHMIEIDEGGDETEATVQVLFDI